MCRTALGGARLLVRSVTDNAETNVAALVVSEAADLAVYTVYTVEVPRAATVIAAAEAEVGAAVVVGIPAPLQHITAHVIQAISVRSLLGYWM